MLLGYLSSMILGFFLGRRTELRLHMVSECLIPEAIHSQSALTSFKDQIRFYNNAVLMGEVSFVESARAKADETRKALQTIIALERKDLRKKQAFEETLRQFGDFTTSAQIVYATMSSIFEGDDQDTAQALNEGRALEDQAAHLALVRQRLLERLNTFAEASSQELQLELLSISMATRHQHYVNLVMFFGVAVSTLILIAIIIKRSITYPLFRIVEIAGDVAAGKDQIQWLPEGHDEIGVLNRALRVMTENLQTEIKERKRTERKLTSYRDRLEELVEDRTAELTAANAKLHQEISERRQAEDALKKAKEDAENANRAKSEFLANMSHEIRTPMNTVLGFTELLDELITDPRQKGYLDAINTGGKSLLTLIDDILDLSKIEAGKMEIFPEPVNLKDIFQELTQVFRLKIAEKGLDMEVKIAPDFPDSLLLDEGRVRQVLFNLLGNAIKFTDTGYIKLTTEASESEGDAGHCHVIIGVEDSGIGISENHRKRIFEAFTQQDGQTSRKYGGTGLGLAITKRLVEAMGGTITVTSEVGSGSLFSIVFRQVPIVTGEPVFPPKKPVDARSFVFEEATILVVDDISTNRVLIKEFFRETNLTVLEAENGEQALLLAQEYQPDLILMDLRMPVMDGYEATKQIKNVKKLQGVPIVALTASVIKPEKNKIYNAGFSSYLIKPVSRSAVLQAAASFLSHSSRDIPSEGPEVLEPSQLLAADTLEQFPVLIAQLEDEGMTLWNTARRSGGFDDIEAFGVYVQQLGEHYGVELLQEFGENALEQAKNFDVRRLGVLLESYPELIRKVTGLKQR